MEAPLIFAIETSGKTGGLALFKEKLIGEITLSSKESYSTLIFKSLPFLEKLLNFSLKDIDYYAIDIGPGSFTGLRIGLSIIKGFYLVFPKPIISICSLEILATNFIGYPGTIITLIDAYSKEVFFASYEWKNFSLKTKILPICISIKEIPNFVKTPSLFISETLEKWDNFLKKSLNNLYLKPSVYPSITAGLLAKLAYLKLKEGTAEIKTAEELLPLYLKASEAERKFLKI